MSELLRAKDGSCLTLLPVPSPGLVASSRECWEMKN